MGVESRAMMEPAVARIIPTGTAPVKQVVEKRAHQVREEQSEASAAPSVAQEKVRQQEEDEPTQ